MSGPRTDAQNRATMRNWGIRQLRALYGQTHMLSRERGDQVRAIIDDELAARGAKTSSAHAAESGVRVIQDLNKRRALRGERELPF